MIAEKIIRCTNTFETDPNIEAASHRNMVNLWIGSIKVSLDMEVLMGYSLGRKMFLGVNIRATPRPPPLGIYLV